jgi:hypothetical protein
MAEDGIPFLHGIGEKLSEHPAPGRRMNVPMFL